MAMMLAIVSTHVQLLKGSVHGFTPNDDDMMVSCSPTGGVFDAQSTQVNLAPGDTFTSDTAPSDRNSDMAFRSNLGFCKVTAMIKASMNFKSDMGAYCREMM